MEKPGVILILSGGIDSTVLLYHLLDKGYEVEALSFNYGQIHHRELKSAYFQAQQAGVEHKTLGIMNLASILGENLLTNSDTWLSADARGEPRKMTTVPNRNMVSISMATSYAITSGRHAVAIGTHLGDIGYPDCREVFSHAIAQAMALCHYDPILLVRPFVRMTKAEVIQRGHELGVDFFQTYSCYRGEEMHCGRCVACVERIQAFRTAGVKDLTVYQSLPT